MWTPLWYQRFRSIRVVERSVFHYSCLFLLEYHAISIAESKSQRELVLSQFSMFSVTARSSSKKLSSLSILNILNGSMELEHDWFIWDFTHFSSGPSDGFWMDPEWIYGFHQRIFRWPDPMILQGRAGVWGGWARNCLQWSCDSLNPRGIKHGWPENGP